MFIALVRKFNQESAHGSSTSDILTRQSAQAAVLASLAHSCSALGVPATWNPTKPGGGPGMLPSGAEARHAEDEEQLDSIGNAAFALVALRDAANTRALPAASASAPGR